MDRKQLIEATANEGGNGRLTSADVERVFDSLFGTVEHSGAIAKALGRGESVVLGGFRMDDDTAAFHPGKARTEFLRGHTG
jgi:DNA-binding protein HU-beta